MHCFLQSLQETSERASLIYYHSHFKDMETEAQYVDIFHTAVRVRAGIQTQE